MTTTAIPSKNAGPRTRDEVPQSHRLLHEFVARFAGDESEQCTKMPMIAFRYLAGAMHAKIGTTPKVLCGRTSRLP
ncbi:hypothetical protein LTT66_12380 [Nocardia gipuzkoensis]|uniref:hypothetical protein n=1 Tax=Nocardia gipuzkoensis TaxID=2749991 RepID=UPI001E4204D1|nr:hypothetical protein [Nocardia gipuzkoensis]UGT70895.1 hypothetical protein LTT66_12380 [Nocardia gipuzkoensis]